MKRKYIILAFFGLLMQNNASSQITHNGNQQVSGDYAGYDGTNGSTSDFNIENRWNAKNMIFKTNNSGTSGSATQRMTILSTGEVGIGNITPAFKLDVDGDIHFYNASNGLKLPDGLGNHPYFLWNNGAKENVYLGLNSGNTYSEYFNTLLGYYCGSQLHSGGGTNSWYNTFVGSLAGAGDYATNSYGRYGYNNTGVGVSALQKTDAYGGSAVGYLAATNNKTGCSITAMGEHAMYGNTAGNDNCAFGYNSLYNNTELSDNVALGAEALFTQSWAPTAGTCSYDIHNIYQTGCKSSFNVAVGNSALYYNSSVLLKIDKVL